MHLLLSTVILCFSLVQLTVPKSTSIVVVPDSCSTAAGNGSLNPSTATGSSLSIFSNTRTPSIPTSNPVTHPASSSLSSTHGTILTNRSNTTQATDNLSEYTTNCSGTSASTIRRDSSSSFIITPSRASSNTASSDRPSSTWRSIEIPFFLEASYSLTPADGTMLQIPTMEGAILSQVGFKLNSLSGNFANATFILDQSTGFLHINELVLQAWTFDNSDPVGVYLGGPTLTSNIDLRSMLSPLVCHMDYSFWMKCSVDAKDQHGLGLDVLQLDSADDGAIPGSRKLFIGSGKNTAYPRVKLAVVGNYAGSGDFSATVAIPTRHNIGPDVE